MFEMLKNRLARWKRKREWNEKRQIQHLRAMVLDDRNWLFHDDVARALTERYEKMLADDWEQQPTESISNLRTRLLLDPNRHAEIRISARMHELEELLRSAHCIADRKGADTAWERFSDSCKKVGIGSVTARTYQVLPSDLNDGAEEHY